MRNLDVFVDNVYVGSLHDSDPLSFNYAQDCLSGLVKVPFSGIIPLRSGIISTIEVMAFFENLLPEGDQRTLLEARHHVSTVFGLLATVGGDTAGSVVILPEGETPQKDDYLAVTWQEIASIINNAEDVSSEISAAADSNVSLSGAQSKLLLSIGKDGAPLLPLNSSISTHILKPDIKRSDLKVWGSAINETLIMKLAALCDMPVAEIEYVPAVQACMVERYDREMGADGNFKRLYQADLCQLLNKPSTVKYQNDGGPSFKDCYEQVKRKSAVPLIDCRNLLKWLLFNLMIGNNDSHAKNISMVSLNGRLRLAPFYDLMCTRVYPGLSSNFAFMIGKHYQVSQIDHNDICALAESIGVKRNYIIKLASQMAKQIESSLPKAVEDVTTKLEYIENVLCERMVHGIDSILKKTKNGIRI
jgi:serine/threonine-protein kinase HipA